jgi:hypothetical protein
MGFEAAAFASWTEVIVPVVKHFTRPRNLLLNKLQFRRWFSERFSGFWDRG